MSPPLLAMHEHVIAPRHGIHALHPRSSGGAVPSLFIHALVRFAIE